MGVVVVTMVVLFIGFIVYTGNKSHDYDAMSSRQLALRCLATEGEAMHIHSHLSIMINKQLVSVPTHIGVNTNKNCIDAVHTHDGDGLIHVESPAKKDFTLGDFFAVWDKPFSQAQILESKVNAEYGLKLYIDGKESSNFDSTILKDHQELFIDYYRLADGPDSMPQPYQWDKMDKQS